MRKTQRTQRGAGEAEVMPTPNTETHSTQSNTETTEPIFFCIVCASGSALAGTEHRLIRQQISRRAPRLPRHPPRDAAGSMKPFIEFPIVHGIGLRQMQQGLERRTPAAATSQCHYPEAADQRPAAAVVILILQILRVTAHVGAPFARVLFDRNAS